MKTSYGENTIINGMIHIYKYLKKNVQQIFDINIILDKFAKLTHTQLNDVDVTNIDRFTSVVENAIGAIYNENVELSNIKEQYDKIIEEKDECDTKYNSILEKYGSLNNCVSTAIDTFRPYITLDQTEVNIDNESDCNTVFTTIISYVEKLRADLQTSQESLDRFKERDNSSSTQDMEVTDDCEVKLEKCNAEVKDIQKKLTAVEITNEQYSTKMKKLKKKLNSSGEVIEKHGKEIEELKNNISSCRENLETCNLSLVEKTEKLEALNDIEAKIIEISKKLSDKESELQHCLERASEHEAQYLNYKTLLELKDVSIKPESQSNSGDDALLKKLSDEVEKYKNSNDWITGQLNEKYDEILAKNAEILNMQEIIKNLTETLEKKEPQDSAKTEALEKLIEDLEIETIKLQDSKNDLESQKEKLEKEKSACLANYEQLQSNIIKLKEEAEKSIADLQQQLQEKETTLSSILNAQRLSEESGNKDDLIKALRVEIETLNAEISKLKELEHEQDSKVNLNYDTESFVNRTLKNLNAIIKLCDEKINLLNVYLKVVADKANSNKTDAEYENAIAAYNSEIESYTAIKNNKISKRDLLEKQFDEFKTAHETIVEIELLADDKLQKVKDRIEELTELYEQNKNNEEMINQIQKDFENAVAEKSKLETLNKKYGAVDKRELQKIYNEYYKRYEYLKKEIDNYTISSECELSKILLEFDLGKTQEKNTSLQGELNNITSELTKVKANLRSESMKLQLKKRDYETIARDFDSSTLLPERVNWKKISFASFVNILHLLRVLKKLLSKFNVWYWDRLALQEFLYKRFLVDGRIDKGNALFKDIEFGFKTFENLVHNYQYGSLVTLRLIEQFDEINKNEWLQKNYVVDTKSLKETLKKLNDETFSAARTDNAIWYKILEQNLKNGPQPSYFISIDLDKIRGSRISKIKTVKGLHLTFKSNAKDKYMTALSDVIIMNDLDLLTEHFPLLQGDVQQISLKSKPKTNIPKRRREEAKTPKVAVKTNAEQLTQVVQEGPTYYVKEVGDEEQLLQDVQEDTTSYANEVATGDYVESMESTTASIKRGNAQPKKNEPVKKKKMEEGVQQPINITSNLVVDQPINLTSSQQPINLTSSQQPINLTSSQQPINLTSNREVIPEQAIVGQHGAFGTLVTGNEITSAEIPSYQSAQFTRPHTSKDIQQFILRSRSKETSLISNFKNVNISKNNSHDSLELPKVETSTVPKVETSEINSEGATTINKHRVDGLNLQSMLDIVSTHPDLNVKKAQEYSRGPVIQLRAMINNGTDRKVVMRTGDKTAMVTALVSTERNQHLKLVLQSLLYSSNFKDSLDLNDDGVESIIRNMYMKGIYKHDNSTPFVIDSFIVALESINGISVLETYLNFIKSFSPKSIISTFTFKWQNNKIPFDHVKFKNNYSLAIFKDFKDFPTEIVLDIENYPKIIAISNVKAVKSLHVGVRDYELKSLVYYNDLNQATCICKVDKSYISICNGVKKVALTVPPPNIPELIIYEII